MRVLVTGAKGFVGKSIVAELREHGIDVVELTRKSPKSADEIQGDITDVRSLLEATKNCEAVVHVAGRLSDEKDSYAVNVGGAHNLVEACNKNQLKHIVYISTASVKIAEKGVYASTKLEAEHVLRASGITTTILRPSIIYGDALSGVFGAVAKATKLPFVPVFGDGSWLSAPIRVEDVARAVRIALSETNVQGNTYDVGGPERISFDELVRRVARIYDVSPSIVHVPSWVGLLAAKAFSVLPKPPITRSNILGSTQQIAWDRESFIADFGFVPMPLAEGLQSLIEHQKHEMLKHEADVLFKYIYSRSGKKYYSSDSLRKRYMVNAMQNRMHPTLLLLPFLIGPIDAGTKLLHKKCALQKRLQLAVVLVETDAQSASWLLPKDMSVTSLILRSLFLSASAMLKLFFGVPLALSPKVIQIYAR